MSMTDPIADFLTRIRNCIRARHESITCPKSKLKLRIAEILQQEGYVEAVSTQDTGPQGTLTLVMRYNDRSTAAITNLKRISKPGQRNYVAAKHVPRVRNGLGVAIISTSHGVMTDRDARKRGIGGEVLCEVW